MKPLPHPDNLHLQAAQGWLELGNHLEANEELEKITPKSRANPDVLEIRWAIYAKEKSWEVCLDIANALVVIKPKCVDGWIHRAYSLRRVKDGGLEKAMDALLPAVDKFPKVWIIPYNLACYCSQLGRLEEAQEWFKKAMEINEKAVQRIAVDDPDLLPLSDSLIGS